MNNQNEIITKELVNSLCSSAITKKEYDRIIELINFKVGEIWRKICKISHRKLDWWAFRNDVSLGHGDGSTGGQFDPNEDQDWIKIIGENTWLDNEYYEYNYGFPTRFLWESAWEQEVSNHLIDCKKKLDIKQKQQKKHQEIIKHRKTLMRLQIESKLTKEELKYITFK